MLDPSILLFLLVHDYCSSSAKPFESSDHVEPFIMQLVELIRVAVVIVDGKEVAVMQLACSYNTIKQLVFTEEIVV